MPFTRRRVRSYHNFGAASGNPPNQPTISAGSLTASGATLTGSAFSDPDVGDTHAASQWQVTTAADTGYASPGINTGDDATHLTSLAVSGLSPSTAYIARVRYKDNHGNYSAWSASASFTTGAAGTTFTNAIRFAGATHGASAAHHASYDDLPAFTLAIRVRWDGASGNGVLAAKRDSTGQVNGWRVNLAGTTATDLAVDYATVDGFKRATDLVADNSWQWLFIGSDRSAHTTTRATGPAAGPINDVHTHPITDGGSGAFVTDAAQPFSLGFDGNSASASVMEISFIGIAGSLLTLAQEQAIQADALAQAALFIDYYKPNATGGSGTSIPSGKGVLPPLVTLNATVV